jgi:hypothetical protein
MAPGLSLRANPGLKLASAFGVKFKLRLTVKFGGSIGRGRYGKQILMIWAQFDLTPSALNSNSD